MRLRSFARKLRGRRSRSLTRKSILSPRTWRWVNFAMLFESALSLHRRKPSSSLSMKCYHLHRLSWAASMKNIKTRTGFFTSRTFPLGNRTFWLTSYAGENTFGN